MHRPRLIGLVAALVLLAAGCGGEADVAAGGGTSAEEATGESSPASTPTELEELTAVIPFPSGAVFYPLFVAEERGYFAEEGVSVDTVAVDGSGAVLQQLLSGQAQVGLPSPGPFMQAVHEGAELRSIYTLFQSNVFSLVTTPDTDVTSLEDLEGQTVGVGTIDGGETKFIKALLSESAGLEEGDYDILAVGDGGSASVALERGEVAGYAASFPDVAILRLRGLELTDLVPEDFQSFFDSLIVVEDAFAEENPQLVEGIGRALARATVWGLDNPDGVLDITAASFPEEAEDREFTGAMLAETQSLFELPEEADGQWGYAVPEAVERYMGFLVEQGELDEPIDTAVFDNSHVEAYNDFDPADL